MAAHLLLGGGIGTIRTSQTNLSMSSAGGFLGQDASADDEDDDEDDDDEDDDELDLAARRRSLRSADDSDAAGALSGLKLDPYDPNPAIKPRPGRYG